MTPLQARLEIAFAAIIDARNELSEDDYGVFISILCNRVGLEAGRLLVGEITRGLLLDDDSEAA